MCSDCWNQALLNMAATGSTSTTWPSTMRNPAGLFIQALAEMTKMAEAVPLMAIGNAGSQCARGERRSQPSRSSPRTMASMTQANPRADGEEDGEPFGPAADEAHVDRVAGPQPQPFGNEEEDG